MTPNKIHKKLGDLSNEEIGALFRSFKSGKKIEHHTFLGTWEPCSIDQSWDMQTAYRIAPEPIRQAVIPWEIFTDDIVAVAMDCDACWFAFTQRPICGPKYWHGDSGRLYINHIKFDRGNETDWRNTLQMRPGHEVL